MEERWSGWDGAAPPPLEGEPRRRLLHPQPVQFSRKLRSVRPPSELARAGFRGKTCRKRVVVAQFHTAPYRKIVQVFTRARGKEKATASSGLRCGFGRNPEGMTT